MLVKVTCCDEIEDQKPFVATIKGRRLCIIRSEGRLYCIEDHCPHQQRSLKDGTVAGRQLVCQNHGVEIDLVTSQITNDMGYLNLSKVVKIPVVEKNNQVYVDLEQDH